MPTIKYEAVFEIRTSDKKSEFPSSICTHAGPHRCSMHGQTDGQNNACPFPEDFLPSDGGIKYSIKGLDL